LVEMNDGIEVALGRSQKASLRRGRKLGTEGSEVVDDNAVHPAAVRDEYLELFAGRLVDRATRRDAPRKVAAEIKDRGRGRGAPHDFTQPLDPLPMQHFDVG
jgi:hypothetical protein